MLSTQREENHATFAGPGASRASRVAAQESTVTSVPFQVKSGFVSKSEMVDLIFSIVAACDFAKVSTASVGIACSATFVRAENGAILMYIHLVETQVHIFETLHTNSIQIQKSCSEYI